MEKIKVSEKSTRTCYFINTVNNKKFFAIGYGNRYRMQQLQQEDWIKQQLYEKWQSQEKERQKEQARHELATHYNTLLKETQEQHAQIRKEMFIANQNTNY